jgi:hypothetical protein
VRNSREAGAWLVLEKGHMPLYCAREMSYFRFLCFSYEKEETPHVIPASF